MTPSRQEFHLRHSRFARLIASGVDALDLPLLVVFEYDWLGMGSEEYSVAAGAGLAGGFIAYQGHAADWLERAQPSGGEIFQVFEIVSALRGSEQRWVDVPRCHALEKLTGFRGERGRVVRQIVRGGVDGIGKQLVGD